MSVTLEQFRAMSADDKWRTIGSNMQATRELVRYEGNIVGFIYRTLGGFYRAYSHTVCMGYGPFDDKFKAEDWVKVAHIGD